MTTQNTDDLVKRLSEPSFKHCNCETCKRVYEAADTIERLQRDLRECAFMFAAYETGRCYQCGWPLKATVMEGCVIGNCSYRPSPVAIDYDQWRKRTDFVARLKERGV